MPGTAGSPPSRSAQRDLPKKVPTPLRHITLELVSSYYLSNTATSLQLLTTGFGTLFPLPGALAARPFLGVERQ